MSQISKQLGHLPKQGGKGEVKLMVIRLRFVPGFAHIPGFAAVFAIALALNYPASAQSGTGPDAPTLMKAAAALGVTGRYQDAAVLYGRAGKLYETAGDHFDAATAQTDSASMYEKWANQLMKAPARAIPMQAAPVQAPPQTDWAAPVATPTPVPGPKQTNWAAPVAGPTPVPGPRQTNWAAPVAAAAPGGPAPGPKPTNWAALPARTPPGLSTQPTATPTNSYQPLTQWYKPIHFAPMQPVPGCVIGRAVFENGTPVPDFQVHVAGMSGKLDPYFNNHLSGPQLTEGATTFADCKGHNGSYSVHVGDDALIFCITAISTFHYHGKIFSLDMWPTDNLGNTTSPGDFRGQVSKGIVRDFVLKSTGLRPDHTAIQFPDHGQAANSTDAFAYYGGTVDLSGDVGSTDADWFGFKTSLRTLYPNGTKIIVTFTPTAPLVDGMPARTLVRSTTFGSGCFCFYGIPYGAYDLTGQVFGANGGARALKMAPQFILTAAGYHAPLHVEWTPFPDGVGLVITPLELWAAPQ